MEEQVENDMKALKMKHWKILINDRREWRKIVHQAKSHPRFVGKDSEEEYVD